MAGTLNAAVTTDSSLTQLVQLAGLPAAAVDGVEIAGTDPVFPTRYRIVAPGAAALAATGLAAADLWALKTGRRQQVRVNARAAAAALRSSRYLKINGERPAEDPETITGFYRLRDGRWMYLHCTHIDLRDPREAETMRSLIRESDVFSQSYRPGALARRGLSPEAVAQLRPGIVYVTLSAWGNEGPWRDRRGYDTVVQSENGMAYRPHNERPAFLPVSAQDYIAGYLLAYGAMVALGRRAREGGSWLVRASLAGAGHWIRQHGLVDPAEYGDTPAELEAGELQSLLMQHDSPVGCITHLAPVVQMSETPARWSRPAAPRGCHPPVWPERGA